MNNDFRFNNNLEQFQYNNMYWKKYDSLINSLSNEQKAFVSKQDAVLTAKQNLISAFIDYLFEQNKSTFILSNDVAQKLADNYLDAIDTAAKSYVSRSEELEKENNELKQQIKQLMLDFGEKNNGKNEKSAEWTW